MTPKQSIELMHAAKVMQKKYRLALKAIRLAQEIMAYCAGDSWEREATEKDRDTFSKIADELLPAPKPVKKKPSRKSPRRNPNDLRGI